MLQRSLNLPIELARTALVCSPLGYYFPTAIRFACIRHSGDPYTPLSMGGVDSTWRFCFTFIWLSSAVVAAFHQAEQNPSPYPVK
jgi:hypothetical protein